MFHVSLAWCNGDHSATLQSMMSQFENICQEYFNIETEMRTFEASGIVFKTGNRLNDITLR